MDMQTATSTGLSVTQAIIEVIVGLSIGFGAYYGIKYTGRGNSQSIDRLTVALEKMTEVINSHMNKSDVKAENHEVRITQNEFDIRDLKSIRK